MATSPDGILTADYLPDQNLVRLVAEGDRWPVPGVLRRNLHIDPRGTAVGLLWGYQLGTGETAATTLVTASTPKRTNLATDPRATDASRWFGSFGTGGAGTETMVAGATDGPLLPDGTRATGYARYTYTAANTGGNSIFGYNSVVPGSNVYPSGTKAGLAIYVRSSRAAPGAVRLYGRGLTAANTQTDPSYSPTFADAPAGQWVRVGMVHTVTSAVGDWLPYAHFSGALFQVGDTVDVVCAMIEPGSFEVGPHFDGDTLDAGGVDYNWTGPANASTSTATFNDGPLLPDGSRIDTYVRRTITAAKTAGSSGPWCRTPTGTFGLVAGDQVSPTMHVRFSVAVTITVQSTARNGSAGAGAVNVANVAVPANTWTRLGNMTTATGPADNTQVWAVLAAGTILPVGTTVDTTGGQSELGATTPYFDGNTIDVSGARIYSWVSAENASASVEEQVTGPAQFVEIERSAAGMATERVNSDLPISAPGGWYTGVDAMAPMNAAVTYTITARTEWGEFVGSATVTVDTSGAVWGLWLKNPGDPSLNTRVEWRGIGTRASGTQGARYDPPGSGFAIVEWDGVGPEEVTIQVATRTGAETRALDALLNKARVLFLQSDPSEMPNGYYYVPSVGRDNPAQVIDTVEGYRVTAIPLVRSEAPAGESAGYTGGPTFQSVLAQYATFQDVLDQVPTFLGLTNPETI